jgi:hypothetical protein
MRHYSHHVIAWGKAFAECISQGRRLSCIATKQEI